MTRFTLALAVACLVAGTAPAADRPAKEPAYQTKTPKYGRLAFGPDGKDRVWLVWDGETLYVDRDGSGDLTAPAAKVAAQKPRHGGPREEDDGYSFEVGDLTLGGKTHKGLTIFATPLKRYTSPSVQNLPGVKAVLEKDPKAMACMLRVEAEVPGLKGNGVGGRVVYLAGPLDLNGGLLFADEPARAPVVRAGGPLEINFYTERPSLRVGRESEFTFVIGTPGDGPGTFAMIGYEGTVPGGLNPVAEVTYPPAKPDDPPVIEKYEIKGRC
jgi:hypothetical protein